jgi:hypothetical protein
MTTPQRLSLSVCLVLSAAAVATAQTISVNGQDPPAEISVSAATSITWAVSDGPVYDFSEPANPQAPTYFQDDQKKGITNAFATWNQTLAAAGINLSFRIITDAERADPEHHVVPKLQLRKTALGTNKAGNFFPGTPLSNKRIQSATIFFTSDTSLLLSIVGYEKAGLHESGHGMGLAHPWATKNDKNGDIIPPSQQKAGTVMNTFGFPLNDPFPIHHRDDFLGNIANPPNICDIDAVKLAAQK